MPSTPKETIISVLNYLDDGISSVDGRVDGILDSKNANSLAYRVSILEDIAEMAEGQHSALGTQIAQANGKLSKVPFLDSVNTQDEFVEAVANSVITIVNGDDIAY